MFVIGRQLCSVDCFISITIVVNPDLESATSLAGWNPYFASEDQQTIFSIEIQS